MVAPCRALSLVVLVLAVVAAGAVPALGQDFDFTAVPKVTIGLTNQGVVGAICSNGVLNFSKSGTPAVTVGSLVSGTEFRCQDTESTFPLSGGSLTFFSANRSVTGTVGDQFLVGHALPNGHALIAAETFGPNDPAPFGVGLTAMVERHGATFAQSDLTGPWRIVGLDGQKGFAGGASENFFGSITFFANQSATGALNVVAPNSFQRLIDSASISINANGSITGVITTVEEGDIFTDVTVNAVMTPDKTVVVGTTASDRFEDFRNGLFFMQKDPGATPFTAADLAGSWHIVALQALPGDSADGNWFTGGVSFGTAGNASHVTASNLADSGGTPFPAVSDSFFFVNGNGVVSGEAVFADAAGALGAFGTMSKDKKHIVGITVFGDPLGDGGISLSTLGMFSMVKLAPPPPASTVRFSTGNYSVQEGMTATITVTRGGATTTAVTVDYVATDPFVEGSLASGTLMFPAGATSRTFTVPTFNNFTNDPDRLITLTLSNPTNGATLGSPSTANLIVLNDDSTFAFSQGTFTVSESAKKATITVTRSGGLAFPTSVPFMASAGTAIAGKDFVPVAGNLSFAKNVTTAKFDVIVKDNNILDGNRSVTLELFPTVIVGRPAGITPAGAPHPTAQLIITDDDTPGVIKLSSATYSGDEGKSVTITILRAPAVAGQSLGGNVSVEYFTSDNGSAVGGMDYTVAIGSVTFTGTQTMQTVSIPLTKDNIAEGPEYFLFNIGMPTNGATLGSPSTARVNINDIDKGGIVTLSANKYSVSEGAGNISITVKRTGGTAANVSVLFTTGGGTATGGVDYGNVSTTVVFGLNEMTRTVVIPIFQDLIAEGDETFNVTLSNPQGGATLGSPSSAVVTIVDDESSFKFAQAAFDTKEGTPGKITVLRSGALGTAATVTYNISSISAFPGVDFTGPVSGVLSFKPQDTQQFFMIPTINNTKVDGNRSVLITLSNPTGGAQLASPSTATFTIVDDDQAGRIQLGSANYTVKEGGSVTVDIMRLPVPGNGGPLGGNISVSYTTVNGNASAPSDFGAVSGIVTFGPMETKKQVTITTTQNTLVDPNKNFFFTLSAPTGGAQLGAPSTATILIQDDDSAGVVFFSQKAYSVSEAAGNISITVMRTGGTANASVQFTTVPGTATSGDRAPLGSGITPGFAGLNDFGFVNTTLFFGAGEMKKTVVVPIFQDNAAEGDEVFFVLLSNPQGGLKLGNPSNSSVTIVDDEVVIQFSGKFKDNQPVVVRTGSLSANVSVDYVATSGTAIINDDFILPPGTLVFPPGVSVRTIPVKVINDNIAEGTETFTITLLNPSPPAQLGPNFQQVFDLLDNDFGGTVSFSNTSPTASIGETKPITIQRAGGAGTVMTVGWAAIGGTAVAGTDFSPASGQVTFLANQSAQTFFVNIANSPSTQGKTIVFGLMPPGLNDTPPSSKLGAANVSTLTVLGTPPAAGNYDFTILYSGADAVGLPSINDGRIAAFSVNEETTNVFSVNVDSPLDLHTAATLPSETLSFLNGNRYPADSGENVAFLASLALGGNGVVVGFNNSTTTVYSSGATLGDPALSYNGTLAFKGFIPECMENCDAILAGGVNGVSTFVKNGDTAGEIGFLDTIGSTVAVNDQAVVAFRGTTFGGVTGVFTTPGDGFITTISTTADETYVDYGDKVSINNSGEVAFVGILPDGNSSVVVAVGEGMTSVATTSPGGFVSFGTVSDATPVISNSGVVAFVAFFADGSSGIFTGTDLVANKVVRTGDVIGGHTVASLALGGVNADGQISFRAVFTDDREAAIVATPNQAPCDCGRPPLRRP